MVEVKLVVFMLLALRCWAAAGAYIAPPWACSPPPHASNPLCPGPARGDSRCSRQGCAPDAGCARQECNAVQGAIAGTVVVQDAWLSIRGSSCKKTQWTLSECCALCQESPRCNAWSYCNDPNGCGTGCVAGQHEHIAAEIPVYTISPMTYTRRLNPEHSCTAAGAWPYGTCSLLYVDGPARPEAPPLMKDAKANVGWVSGIVSKAVSAEVSIAALPDRPGARPAERHTDRRRAPAQLQEEEEQQLQDREVDRREAIEEQIRHRWQQRQHRQAKQDRQQAPGSNRPTRDSLHKQEPAPKPVEQERKDGLPQHTPQQLHQHTERPAERLERPSTETSTHDSNEPQRSSAAEEPNTGAAAPKAAEPKADPAGSLGAAQKPAVVEVPHKGPRHVASLPRAAYDMQPVPDDDPDAPKTRGQPQPAKAAATAVTGSQTQDAAPKQNAKPKQEAAAGGQPQPAKAAAAAAPEGKKQEAKPSYVMQPVPDDDPDAPKTSPPQPAPLASAKAVAPAPAPAQAPATATGKQQPELLAKQQPVKPSYEMQPVPDDDPDAPKTGQTPQQPSAAGTSAHGARQARAPAQQQVQVASTKLEAKPEQKPQAQPTAQQHVVSQPKPAAEPHQPAVPNTPHKPVAAKEPPVPDISPEVQHKQQQQQPQPKPQQAAAATKPTAAAAAAAAAQPAPVTKTAAESPASKPSQQPQQGSKPADQAQQPLSQQPAPAQPKAAAAATVAAIAGPAKAAVQQSTQAADKPTQPQAAPQAPPQQVTPSQPAAQKAGDLVQEIAALPLTDPQQIAAVEQARLAEQRQEAQRARQQQDQQQKAPAAAAAKDGAVQEPTAQRSLPAAGPQAAEPTATQAQPKAAPAQTVPASEPPVQAHLFTTTEFPTADADMQPSSDVPEIGPASPSQSLKEPVATEVEEKEKELPGQQEGKLSVATNSSDSTAANTSNSSSLTAAVGAADASDTKKPTTTPTGRPIAVEQDQTRTLPPKKAPAAAKRNAAAGMASGSCTAVAVALGALLLLLWL